MWVWVYGPAALQAGFNLTSPGPPPGVSLEVLLYIQQRPRAAISAVHLAIEVTERFGQPISARYIRDLRNGSRPRAGTITQPGTDPTCLYCHSTLNMETNGFGKVVEWCSAACDKTDLFSSMRSA